MTTTKKFGFLADFKKAGEKMEGVVTSAEEPRYYHSSGNYLLNAIMTGHYRHFLPQGRISCMSGPSGSGKSFGVGNTIKQAQADGAMILVVDSEGALDNGYMNRIGVNTSEEANYYYRGVSTLPQAIKVISSFIKGYRSEFGTAHDAPKAVIALDSLDMLLTESEAKLYDTGGEIRGDQGQKSKQLKSMLKTLVQDIKELNIAMIVTHQVYKNQDLLNGEGVWIINGGVRYSLSHIVLLTALKLREGTGATAEVTGIRLRAEGYKTRFTKPYQKITLEIPYNTGMDPFSGLLEAAVSVGIVSQGGSWFTLVSTGDKFQRKNFSDFSEQILAEMEAAAKPLMVAVDDGEEEDTSAQPSRKKQLTELLNK